MHEIKVENKNIIITDPCYLDNVMDENDKTVGLYDYWKKFLAGANGNDYTPSLQRFGFHDCIACPTLYGDWSCTAYLVDFDPRDIKTVDDIKTIFEQQTMRYVGHFCADAGIVCVVDSECVKKFNPHFFEWAFYHQHCVASIPHFTGTIGIVDVDPQSKEFPYFKHRLIYGIADKEANPNGKNFVTFQTGL